MQCRLKNLGQLALIGKKKSGRQIVVLLLKKILFIWVAGLLFVGTVAAQEKSEGGPSSLRMTHDWLSKTEAEIYSTFRAYSFDEKQDKSQLVQLYIEPKLLLNLHSDFKVRAKGSISLSTARVQARFEDPTFNTLNLNELVLSYEPAEFFNIEAGALDQNQLNAPMLVYERSFPGAMVKSRWAGPNSTLGFKAQYSIPNSVSMESDRIENEAMPSFATQGFDWQWTPKSWFSVSADIHHFTYRDLPSVVAFQSGRLGNEVIGENSSESYFAFDFDGFAQSYVFNFDISKSIKNHISVQIIENMDAPSDRNRSQWTGAGFDFYFKDVVLSPSLAYFYAESDSVPALYSAVQLGRNNRQGMFYSMKVRFPNLGFVVSANYVQAKMIEAHPIQNDLNAFEFLVELPSVKF